MDQSMIDAAGNHAGSRTTAHFGHRYTYCARYRPHASAFLNAWTARTSPCSWQTASGRVHFAS
ncbi:hypothetical protein ACFPRL_27340 [Pseudoclavibacter helvolus]